MKAFASQPISESLQKLGMVEYHAIGNRNGG